MSNSDTTSELEKLRAEVAALKEAKREDAAHEAAAESPVSARQEAAGVAEAEVEEEEVKGQLEELASLLDAEIRDLPTITTLAVFTLGILMGRLLR